jgi:hypothetical protein
MLFIAHLCNHILLQSGGGTWGTALHTVRRVGSGSRDVDAWTQTTLYAEDRGPPSTDDPDAAKPHRGCSRVGKTGNCGGWARRGAETFLLPWPLFLSFYSLFSIG